MSVATPTSQNLIGIFFAIVASIAFSLNDVGIKFLSGDYPLHEVVLIRATIALSVTVFVFLPLEGGLASLKTTSLHLHILRGLLVVLANMSFFTGLAAIPLSEATAIFFVSPLAITAFSVFFLGEQVSYRRWIAVIAGLAGAIIMLRPGTESFRYAALFPLAAAFAYAGLHTVTRIIGLKDKASAMAFYIQVTFIVVSSLIGLLVGDGRFSGSGDKSVEFLFRAWVVPTFNDFLIMAAVGVASAFGGYSISQAYRLCQAAVIAPFEYIALILAILWGIFLFGEWPDFIAWSGMALILGAGLFVIWREWHLKRSVAAARPMPRHR